MNKLRLFALLAVLAFVLTACGGGAPTKLKVAMDDFKFDKDNYSAAASQEITMDIKNEGEVEHEFVIMKYGLTIGDDFGPEDEDNIYWEVEVEPGASKTVTFTAPDQPGEYQVVCGTQGHFMAGMASKLTLVESTAAK